MSDPVFLALTDLIRSAGSRSARPEWRRIVRDHGDLILCLCHHLAVPRTEVFRKLTSAGVDVAYRTFCRWVTANAGRAPSPEDLVQGPAVSSSVGNLDGSPEQEPAAPSPPSALPERPRRMTPAMFLQRLPEPVGSPS